MEKKILTIIPKSDTRQHMNEIGDSVFLADRELFVETEGEGSQQTLRFKIGDGMTPYPGLPYVSSLYSLFPNCILYSKDYKHGVKINWKGTEPNVSTE